MDSIVPLTWNTQEEGILICPWITIIEEAYLQGPPQCRIGSFWSRVFHLFHYEMGQGYYRTKKDVKLKML